MVIVRVAHEADTATVGQVITRAFNDPLVAVLADRLRHSDVHLPALSLVADDDGEVIGTVMLTRATVRHVDGGSSDVLNLSPLAVTPERQRQGIGRLLVETAVRSAAELGESLILLEGDPALYRRMGFVSAADCGITPPSPSVPDSAFQVLPLTDDISRAAGMATYPPPFWSVGVGLPEPVDDTGPYAVPWLFEFARYAGWLESVASGDHNRPVPACPGWTVGEVLRHLGVVFRVVRRWIQEGRRPSDVASEPVDGDLDAWYSHSWRDLFNVLASQPYTTQVATWSPWEDTLGFWRRRMTHEASIHALDVLAAVPGHATPWTASDALASDGIDEALRLWLGTRLGRCVGGSGQVIRVEASQQSWTVGLHPSIVEFHHRARSADARVSGRAEELYAWLWGRTDDVTIDGDHSAVNALRNALTNAMQ